MTGTCGVVISCLWLMAAKYVRRQTVVLMQVHSFAGEWYLMMFFLNSCSVALSGPGLSSVRVNEQLYLVGSV